MTNCLDELFPNYDLEAAVSGQDHAGVEEYVQCSVMLMLDHVHNDRYEALEELMNRQYRSAARSFEQEKAANPLSFQLGYLSGALAVTEEVLRKHSQQIQFQTFTAQTEWNRIPHLLQILEAISRQPGIQHARLAEAVHLNASTLTGLMHRIEEAGLIASTRSGKFKYYRLTPSGSAYFRTSRPILEKAAVASDTAIKEQMPALEKAVAQFLVKPLPAAESAALRPFLYSPTDQIVDAQALLYEETVTEDTQFISREWGSREGVLL